MISCFGAECEKIKNRPKYKKSRIMITSKLFPKFKVTSDNKKCKKNKKTPIRYNKIVLFTSYKMNGPMMKFFL